MLKLNTKQRHTKKTYSFEILNDKCIIGSGTVTAKGVRLRWRGGNNSWDGGDLKDIFTTLEELQDSLIYGNK